MIKSYKTHGTRCRTMAIVEKVTIDIGLKLAVIVAKKWATAKYGDNVAEISGAVIECFAGQADKKTVCSIFEEITNPLGNAATVEDYAGYYLSSLEPEQVQKYIARCYQGKSTIEEASDFARQLWLVTVSVRLMVADEEVRESSVFEELCKKGLQEAFLKITASARFHSDSTRRIEKIVERIDQNLSDKDENRFPHFLTNEESTGKCWNREKELKDLQKIINANERLILINGFGGIGKSAIAKELFHRIHQNYSFAGFIPFNSNLSDSINIHFHSQSFPWEYIVENPSERIRAICNFLQDESGAKLLIIDNYELYDSEDDLLNALSKKTNLTIIITSRSSKIENYTTYTIDTLSNEECKDLFIEYYVKNGGILRESDQEIVDKMVQLVHRHTLSIELLAKTACECPYKLDEFYKKIAQSFACYDDVEVRTETAEATIKNHLKSLFDWHSLSTWGDKANELLRILRNISLMPSVKIPSDVSSWIACEHRNLIQLDKSGWLSFDRTEKTFYMHPLIKEILLMDFDKYEENIGHEFFVSLQDLITYESETYVQVFPKFEIADGFLSQIKNQENELYILACASLGKWHIKYGDFHGAQPLVEKAWQLCKIVFGEDSTNYAKVCDLLATIKEKYGMFSEAEALFRKSIEIEEKSDEKDSLSIATSYNNLAGLLQEIDNFEEAEQLLKKGLQICEDILGQSDIHTIDFKESLGTFYVRKGEFDKAESLLLEVVSRHEKEFGTNHPATAVSYNNIGGLFFSSEQYNEAEVYFRKALEIKLKFFGEESLQTALSYFNMGMVNYNLEKYDVAAEYFCRAGRIRFKELGEKHPDFIATANYIFYSYLASPVIPGEHFEDWLDKNIPEIKDVYHD